MDCLSQQTLSELAQNHFVMSENQKQQLAQQVQKQQQKLSEYQMTQVAQNQSSQQSQQSSKQQGQQGQESQEGQGQSSQQNADKKASSEKSSSQGQSDQQNQEKQGEFGKGDSPPETREIRFTSSKKTQSLLQTLPSNQQIDWEHTVMLGQGMGATSIQQSSENGLFESNVLINEQTIAIKNQEIPPNQRMVVKDFFQESE